MRIGGQMFFTDYSMTPTELARALEERGFEFALGTRTLPHSVDAQVALPERRRSAEEILRRDGPVRGAECGGSRHQDAAARHRHLPDRAARPDPDRQAGRLDRPGLGRPFPVRRRQRLERGRDGQPRHRFRDPPQAGARAYRGHEGDLDQVKGRVSWRIREFRADDDLAEAGPEAASADPGRRGLPLRRAAGPALTATAGCLTASRSQYADVQALLPKFREMAAEAGRDLASVPITIWGAKENLDLLKRDRDDGVSRVVVSLDSAKADTILPELDRWANLIRQLGSDRNRSYTSGRTSALNFCMPARTSSAVEPPNPKSMQPTPMSRNALMSAAMTPAHRRTGGVRHRRPAAARSRRTPCTAESGRPPWDRAPPQWSTCAGAPPGS